MTDLVSIGFKADTGDLKAAGREFDNLGRKGAKAERDTKRSTAAMVRDYGRIKVAALGAAAGIAAVGTAALVLNSARRNITVFGQSIADLSAITGAAGRDLEFYSEQAKEIGRTTSLSASQAVEAFKLIGSAKPDLLGSAAALNQVTREAVTLAEAAGIELPAAASALGSALNQFQLDAGSANEVINILAASAKFGAAEIPAVTEALRNAGPAANALNVDLAETVAGIQALAISGRQGADAGTGLRQVLLRLEKTADAELQPSVVGLSNALLELESRNLSNTELMELFGDEAFAAATSLLTQAGNVEKLNSQLRGTETATEQAAIRMDTLKGDTTEFNSAMEALSITIGEKLEPALRQATQSATGFVNWLTGQISGGTEIERVNEQIAEQTLELQRLAAEYNKPRLLRINPFESTEELGERVDAQRQVVADLHAEYRRLNLELVAMPKATKPAAESAGELSEEVQEVAGTVAKLNNEITRLTSADEAWMDSAQDTIKAIDALEKSMNPLMAEYQEWIENENLVKRAMDLGLISKERGAELIEQLGEEFNKANQSQREFVDDAADESSAFETAWQRSVERINDIFADMFTSIFSGFEDFGEQLKSGFSRLLGELAQAAVSKPILISLGLGGSGTASAAGIQNIPGVTQGGGFVGDIFNLARLGNFKIQETIATAGIELFGRGFETIGDFITSNAGLIAGAAPFASGVFSLFSGEVEKGIGQTLGAAAGTLLGGGPIGGFIGSALGGVVGGLFGGKDLPRRSAGAATVTSLDGVISSDIGRPEGRNTFVESIGEAVEMGAAGFVSNLSALLQASGLSGDVTATGSYSGRAGGSGYSIFDADFAGGQIRFDRKAKDDFGEEDLQRFLGEITGDILVDAIRQSDIAADIKALFDGITDPQQVQQTVQYAIRLIGVQSDLAEAYGLTTDMANDLVNQIGGADGYTSALAGFNAAFLSESEKASRAYMEIADAFAAQNATLPTSAQQYRDIVEAQDLTTASGRELYAFMLQLGPIFKATVDSLESSIGGLYQSILGRTGDAAGIAYYVELLGSGAVTIEDIANSMTNSIEFAANEAEAESERLSRALEPVFDRIRDAISELRGDTQGIDQGAFVRARQIIDQATMTGILPDPDTLNRAVQTVTGGIMAQSFASSVDQQRARLRLANQLESLTGASLISTNSNPQLQAVESMAQSNNGLLQEVKMLREEVVNLRAEVRADVEYNMRTFKILDRVTPEGDAIEVRDVT